MDELTVSPLKTPRKRNPGRDRALDSQGQLVEYERGYLRRKAQAARGVLPSSRKRKEESFLPGVSPGLAVEFLYVLELPSLPARLSESLILDVWWRAQGTAPAPLQPVVEQPELLVPRQEDQALLSWLHPYREKRPGCRGNRYLVPQEAQRALCSLLFALPDSLRWASRIPGKPWQLHRLAQAGPAPWFARWEHSLQGLRRLLLEIGAPAGNVPLEKWLAFSSAGWAITPQGLHLLDIRLAAPQLLPRIGAPMPWMDRREAAHWGELLALDGGADLSQIPEAEQIPVDSCPPLGKLYLTPARFKHLGKEQLQGELSFLYGDTLCPEDSPESRLAGHHQILLRQPQEEERLKERLKKLGFRKVTRTGGDEDPGWKLLPIQLEKAVQVLVLEGWEVTAQGKTYRRPVEKSFGVAGYGLDWLELKANVEFPDGTRLETPQLLQAARKGISSVRLDDGTYGILPREWLEKFTSLVEIGESHDQKVRFRQEQAALLNALLQEQLQDWDGRYGEILENLRHTSPPPESPEPPALPPWFQARLRPYQSAALSWLTRQEKRGLSSILADDMGLGKTVQVLALLARRHQENPLSPSLVVMPSSLLFNWQEEARRFAPALRTACHHGPARQPPPQWLAQYDLVFTTYGTLRQDAPKLAQIPLDYLVLDESQAIKNGESLTAKAARALKARHRLAMTGTPVENHLAELFSQLTFLNPGLFPASLTRTMARDNGLLANPETARRVRQAVAPFLLRRRKEEVAPDLPPKTEQILWCDLPQKQREQYDQLRTYYRQKFSQGGGEAASTNTMLDALLRLRQAACHPGLIQEAFRQEETAKLSCLLLTLAPLLEAGHKALIFSQFTTLLQLVASLCQQEQWGYVYLDGTTQNRKEVVRQFQEDPHIPLFLISLKAGGVGLNLTAADYVFLLDPWWNPAAEAQAIDRCYRIGQTRPVFAYRLVARDTVEEKVLEMQRQKQRVAQAALGENSRKMGDPLETPPELTAEDLRLLLE